VDAATRLSWARIVLAEVAPALLAGAEGEALVPVLADLLRPETAAGLGTVATRTHHSERFTDRPSEGPRDDAPAAAPPPGHGTEGDQAAVGDDVVAPSAAARGAAATAWGGLLFLLNTADAAGLPGRLAAEEALSARPLSWSVQRLGTRLVPALLDDPAVLALAGVDPDLPAPADPAPTWAEDAALDAAAAVWAAVTVALVDGPGERTAAETADRVRAIAARPATVRREPGWVEVELPLETVDLDVRRAGLDLDPGWVWWLGQVVRFGYG
jgi:hypothetical protein